MHALIGGRSHQAGRAMRGPARGEGQGRTTRPLGAAGMTLVEIVAALLIGMLIAAGTLTAFVTAHKLTQIASTQVEATYYSQQTLERFRNKIACRQAGEDDQATWFDGSCGAVPPQPQAGGRLEDLLPSDRSRLVLFRDYEVVSRHVDQDAIPDYFEVKAKTTWTKPE